VSPETYEFGKQVAGWAGVMAGTAIVAWRARGRKDDRDRIVKNGTLPRTLTRKEWHDVRDSANKHGFQLDAMERRLSFLEREFGELQKQNIIAINSLGRLEESFNAHVIRWEDAEARTTEDRQRAEGLITSLMVKVDRLIERA
jgi:hypothetical protein